MSIFKKIDPKQKNESVPDDSSQDSVDDIDVEYYIKNNLDPVRNVSFKYLANRDNVLNYTYEDMNLKLDNEKQVYIAVFDIPLESGIIGHQTQSLAMLFRLNTHLYHGSGEVAVDLEKDPKVMEAMQSLLISSDQVLDKMELVDDFHFYNSDNIRAYLKTKQGIFFKELENGIKEDDFLTAMMNNVLLKLAGSDWSKNIRD